MGTDCTDDVKIAYHEAGHAVIAYILNSDDNMQLGEISVIQQKDYGGIFNCNLVCADDWDKILIYYAGYVSEKIKFPDTDRDYSNEDFAAARLLLKCNPELTEIQMVNKTKQIVLEYWGAIEAVVFALRQKRTLNESEWVPVVMDNIKGCNSSINMNNSTLP